MARRKVHTYMPTLSTMVGLAGAGPSGGRAGRAGGRSARPGQKMRAAPAAPGRSTPRAAGVQSSAHTTPRPHDPMTQLTRSAHGRRSIQRPHNPTGRPLTTGAHGSTPRDGARSLQWRRHALFSLSFSFRPFSLTSLLFLSRIKDRKINQK